jgi:hypothetical protein
MKKAIIISGAHHTGKSKTIRQFLKPLLGIRESARKFILKGKYGYILSQSFEESGRNISEIIPQYKDYNLLVIASRPRNELGSKHKQLCSALTQYGFIIEEVQIQNPAEAAQRAKEIFNLLKK